MDAQTHLTENSCVLRYQLLLLLRANDALSTTTNTLGIPVSSSNSGVQAQQKDMAVPVNQNSQAENGATKNSRNEFTTDVTLSLTQESFSSVEVGIYLSGKIFQNLPCYDLLRLSLRSLWLECSTSLYGGFSEISPCLPCLNGKNSKLIPGDKISNGA
uniref:Uncharacterized protein n=1 Tax=Glossina austeni TaxID=7395 RepID=A0A1A9V220_GLOAU